MEVIMIFRRPQRKKDLILRFVLFLVLALALSFVTGCKKKENVQANGTQGGKIQIHAVAWGEPGRQAAQKGWMRNSWRNIRISK